MDSFEWNKIFGAILVALLIAMVSSLVGDGLISPKKLEKNVFVIDVVETPTDAGKAGGEEEKVDPITPLLVKADAANGEKLSAKLCGQCHTFKKGEPHKTGPNLWSIVGNHYAHASDYAYSNGFKEKHSELWDEEKLNLYLHKPRAFIKGTKMAFAGIRKAEERADVIKYLSTLK